MAEVTRVLREMQLDTERGLVPARGSVPLYSRRRSKFVKDDSAAVGATNADVGSFIGEIGVTKAELANKKAAGTGMVKAASWSDLLGTCGTKPAAGNKTAPGSEPEPKEERKAEPAVAMITKETVPDSFIDRIKTRPSRKLRPLSEEQIEFYTEFSPENPEFLASELANITRWNYFVDLEQDCLRQYAEKGYAEVGVDFTNGIKQIFILPQPQPQPRPK